MQPFQDSTRVTPSLKLTPPGTLQDNRNHISWTWRRTLKRDVKGELATINFEGLSPYETGDGFSRSPRAKTDSPVPPTLRRPQPLYLTVPAGPQPEMLQLSPPKPAPLPPTLSPFDVPELVAAPPLVISEIPEATAPSIPPLTTPRTSRLRAYAPHVLPDALDVRPLIYLKDALIVKVKGRGDIPEQDQVQAVSRAFTRGLWPNRAPLTAFQALKLDTALTEMDLLTRAAELSIQTFEETQTDFLAQDRKAGHTLQKIYIHLQDQYIAESKALLAQQHADPMSSVAAYHSTLEAWISDQRPQALLEHRQTLIAEHRTAVQYRNSLYTEIVPLSHSREKLFKATLSATQEIQEQLQLTHSQLIMRQANLCTAIKSNRDEHGRLTDKPTAEALSIYKGHESTLVELHRVQGEQIAALSAKIVALNQKLQAEKREHDRAQAKLDRQIQETHQRLEALDLRLQDLESQISTSTASINQSTLSTTQEAQKALDAHVSAYLSVPSTHGPELEALSQLFQTKMNVATADYLATQERFQARLLEHRRIAKDAITRLNDAQHRLMAPYDAVMNPPVLGGVPFVKPAHADFMVQYTRFLSEKTTHSKAGHQVTSVCLSDADRRHIKEALSEGTGLPVATLESPARLSGPLLEVLANPTPSFFAEISTKPDYVQAFLFLTTHRPDLFSVKDSTQISQFIKESRLKLAPYSSRFMAFKSSLDLLARFTIDLRLFHDIDRSALNEFKTGTVEKLLMTATALYFSRAERSLEKENLVRALSDKAKSIYSPDRT